MWPWVYLIALIYFVLHMLTSMRYGYFRDALYYLACADHLAFGYVDLPPLFPFIAWIARHTLPMFVLMCVAVLAIWFFPALVTLLPAHMKM